MADNRMDLEEIYVNTIKKTQRLLESKGIALSLKELKKFSMINLAGFRNDGERLLKLELEEKYGENILSQSIGYQILYPFIDEGVIKTTTKRDEIFYTHFRVTAKRENDFDLAILEYDLYNGKFYLRYAITLNGIQMRWEGDDVRYELCRYGCMKNFIFDAFSEKELREYYMPMEYLIVKEFAEREEKICEKQTDIILKQVLSTFSAINFLLERDKKSVKSIRNAKHIKIENDFTDESKIKKKVIHLEENVQLEVAPSCVNKEGAEEKTMKRHTNVWMVSGHLRHYKSGKVIHISPFPKGPERDKMKPKRKDYDLPQENEN